MMGQRDCISRRQTVALAFVSLLSPLIRRFPRVLAATAGRTAWLSALFTALPAAALFALLCRIARHRGGFSALLCDTLGPLPGRALTLLYALWMLFYAGFLLRSGAVRFVSTVYPGAGPWVFIAVSALACTLAALGSLRALARTAMILRPLLLAVPAAAVLLALRDLDPAALLPVTAADLLPNGCAALQTLNVLSVVFYLLFLGERVEGRLRVRDWALWGAVLLVLLGAMTACCIGLFGPELTAKLSFPFFMLVRDVNVLGSLERAEPVVIALWVFSDFVLTALLLQLAGNSLRFCFGWEATDAAPRLRDLSHGRWLIPLCAGLATAVGLSVAPDAASFARFSETIVPLGNALMVFVLPLPALAVALVRKKNA